jgi:hypothetical protein
MIEKDLKTPALIIHESPKPRRTVREPTNPRRL